MREKLGFKTKIQNFRSAQIKGLKCLAMNPYFFQINEEHVI